MNSRDRAPLTLIVVLLLLAALAALLAPFVLADPAPSEPVPDTVEATPPPVDNVPATPRDDRVRIRMANALHDVAPAKGGAAEVGAAVPGSLTRMMGR